MKHSDIIIEEAQTVASCSTKSGTAMVRFADGGVLVGWYIDEKPVGFFTSDAGKTWRQVPWPGNSQCIAGLSDGSILAFDYQATDRIDGGAFHYSSWRIGPGCVRMEGPFHTPVRIPDAADGTGDDLKRFLGLLMWKSIVEMPDGRLLATLYGYFKGDNVPFRSSTLSAYIESAEKAGRLSEIKATSADTVEGFNKYRTVVIESQDRGASWDYLSTVAYEPFMGYGDGTEGPCEPSMVLLRNGDLLCVMRMGYTHDPMIICRSRNGGRSWSKPASTAAFGVCPTLIVLQDGNLACSYGVKGRDGGRREMRLMFSADARGGKWPIDLVVYAGAGGTYPSVCEVAPGELLYAFDANGFPDPRDGGKFGHFLRVARVRLPWSRGMKPTSSLPVDV